MTTQRYRGQASSGKIESRLDLILVERRRRVDVLLSSSWTQKCAFICGGEDLAGIQRKTKEGCRPVPGMKLLLGG